MCLLKQLSSLIRISAIKSCLLSQTCHNFTDNCLCCGRIYVEQRKGDIFYGVINIRSMSLNFDARKLGKFPCSLKCKNMLQINLGLVMASRRMLRHFRSLIWLSAKGASRDLLNMNPVSELSTRKLGRISIKRRSNEDFKKLRNKFFESKHSADFWTLPWKLKNSFPQLARYMDEWS